ncbi:PREDICTED: transmembrane protein 205 [Dinoponera quadriceps]|uniref:Transmembrane protein 205 n=1 Tax=Dinoponera quadriceps TaxID=609295 RepID=A0A6P3X1R2_DINQU|nr:PREDICTED: transmembrane protein 205 [Dinoponera quadriceps]XP_014472311.1 PREDICTED: transmembrane protein 205 [Dinoponera quadriceps]
MCVRSLVDIETVAPSAKQNDRLIRVKEKYVRLHDEMLEREKQELLRQQQQEQATFHVSADHVSPISTIHYSLLLHKLAEYYEIARRTKAFKILFYTAQPAHVIMIAAVLFVMSVLIPTKERASSDSNSHSRTTSFIYLAAFVMHFGAQIWMTFVSGLSLYFALPRHMFGEVQRVLFPRYFTINACLSLITLLIFVKHHPAHTWDTEIAIQVGGMSIAFFLELLIRLYLTPPLLRLIVLKNNLERATGVGGEIGRQNIGPLKHCPYYMKIHRAFCQIHVCIAMGNMLTVACTVLHLHYIASRLCVL